MNLRLRTTPWIVALQIAGAGGLIYGLLDNLPALLSEQVKGETSHYLLLRLKTLAFTIVWYSLAFAAFLGTIGLFLALILPLLRRKGGIGRAKLAGFYAGLLAALLAILLMEHHYGLVGKTPEYNTLAPQRILAGGISLLLGIGPGWLIYSAVRWWEERGWHRLGRGLRWGLGAVFVVAVLALGGVALYRTVLWDKALFQWSLGAAPATPEHPNIVLITIDALRADHLGTYGYDPDVSPHIDALAREGVVFDQVIAQSSWTLPSVSSFITSMHPTELQIACPPDGQPCHALVDEQRTTIAEMLQEAGYHTMACLTNSWLVPQNGFLQGFDQASNIRLTAPYDRKILHQRPLIALSGQYLPWLKKAFDRTYDWIFEPRMKSRHGVNNTCAQRFLHQNQQKRFFLWLYYMEPHPPYNPAPGCLLCPLPEKLGPERENVLRRVGYWQMREREDITPTDRKALLALYDGLIFEADQFIGEILAEVEALGLADRTVIIINADHGEEFNDHGGYTHGLSLHHELVRVPLIVAGPVVTAPGSVVETPARLLDLLPTLAEIAGAPVPKEARGRSLLPALRGEEIPRLPAFSEKLYRVEGNYVAVTASGYKLIYELSQETAELYHLESDPNERVNIADSQAKERQRLLNLLIEWMGQTRDTAAHLPRSTPAKGIDKAMQQLIHDAGY